MSDVWSSLTDLQLFLGGCALLLAAQQVSVWRWEGACSTARAVVPAALATVAVFLTSVATLRSLSSPANLDGWLFARSLALAVLAVCTLPLAASIGNRRPPRVLMATIAATAALRLALLPSTDLIVRHELRNGLPVYGPLMAPTGLAIIVLVFGYLCWIAGHGPTERERVFLGVGLVGSLSLAVASIVSRDPLAAEVLTGYVPLPALVAITVLLWGRQVNAFRTVRRLANRQRALAGLGRLALRAELSSVRTAAERVLDKHAEAPTDPQDQKNQFATAVHTIVAAAEAQSRARDELQRRATIDELTGLPNRTGLRQLINAALRAASTAERTVAVALFDIDRFRSVNDVHGHPAGDEVLEAVARRLSDAAWSDHIVGRFGGDEFVIVCTDAATPEEVRAFGHRIATVFARPIVTPSVDASVTVSVGVTTATPHATEAVDADTLLRDADTAMHDAKAQGGAIIGQFHDGLRSAVVYRADLERRLVGAVARGEIVLHYQPIVGIPDRAAVGFEALARWKQGSTVLPPDQWIPVAESTSLIHEIGEFVLVEAGRQLMSWLDAGHHVGVSVNVSPRQLSSRRLPEAVYRLLSDGVPAELLTLEVTESVAVDEHAAGILTELRDAGVRVALDDFGTGYSALSAVSRLPIDVIKIDRSIVQRIRERDGRAVVAAVLAIAESLELQTVAEGIERLADEWFLAELGCPFGQGYLYHRPLPAAETWQLLADASLARNPPLSG